MKNMNKEEQSRLSIPKLIVNDIFRDKEVNGAKKFAKMFVSPKKCTHQTLFGESITFDEKDAVELTMPHNNVR